MKKIKLALIAALVGASLTGCSSPPPATPVDWAGTKTAMNQNIMDWQPTYNVIKSDKVTGAWSKEITNFIPENRFYDDSVFYAIAHSDQIVIETNNSKLNFFEVKNWLRGNGAYGLIQFREYKNCLTCTSTNVYLVRNGNHEN